MPDQNPTRDDARELFDQLYSQHYRAIFAHVRGLVPNSNDADDVFQETIVTLWEKFDDYRVGGDFRAWACRIAYYKALQHRDRAIRSPRPFSKEFLEVVSEQAIVMSDTLDARSEALAWCRERLSASDQRLLERYYRVGAKAKTVARHLGHSVDTVYRKIRRIHDALAECITRRIASENPHRPPSEKEPR